MRLPRLRFRVRYEQPAPPVERPVVRTHVEVDLSELNITPAVIEPSAYVRRIAADNAGLFIAYLHVGFDREEAFQLLQQQLDAAMHRGMG